MSKDQCIAWNHGCKKGFDILSGNSRVRVCDESGYWHGAIPQCFDVEPPVISNCKAVWYGYAERSETEGRIMWREPSVSDNFDKFVSPYLISGPTPNEMLAAGSYDVIYGAKDSTGNKARSCKMKLVMRVISCSSLYNTPFLKITCPQGYKYGARCNFTCDVGSYINGTLNSEMTTSCEKATDVHYGEWDFGSIQPFCKNGDR
ncbi:hypothetical protein KUTeg_018506 [Tegillarca granosa]|uniref:Uncharacterized protein n=1 Tax=Tegillarca granosa TaxID=220873 RepID=A0ABQ9EI26_TEGGR|nr:hypothetical protein KUTeg_018506 [Tegillarca granosa]